MSPRGSDIRLPRAKNPPCKNCKDRSKSCHAHCSAYADWKEENEEFKAYMRDRINADADVRAFLYNKPKRSPSYYSAKHRAK